MVKEIKNVIPNNLCDKIINTFKNQLVPAEIYKPLDGNKHKVDDTRVALNYFFNENTFPEIIPLKKHISKITNIPIHQQEQFCLIKYDEGGKYDLHYDSSNPNITEDNPRAYSFIFYLNEDFEGGETFFPNLNNQTIKPEKGKMVYWNNFNEEQEFDYTKFHSGLPVTKGNKWILTLWVRDENIHLNNPNFDITTFTSTYVPLSNDNYGYTILKVPDPILKYLKFKVDELQNGFSNKIDYRVNLAGEIKNEYLMSFNDEIYTSFIHAAVLDFDYKSKLSINIAKLGSKSELKPLSHWINFQKKGEYNPFHYHDGVYSYVIWYQIPYYHKDENYASTQPSSKSTSNGDFNFYYQDTNDPLHSIKNIAPLSKFIDKNFEGYMAVFPSSLPHSVNPFYSSDQFRITISGNIGIFVK